MEWKFIYINDNLEGPKMMLYFVPQGNEKFFFFPLCRRAQDMVVNIIDETFFKETVIKFLLCKKGPNIRVCYKCKCNGIKRGLENSRMNMSNLKNKICKNWPRCIELTPITVDKDWL